MSLERWDPSKHLPLLEGWLRALGHEAGDPTGLYPQIGFVADECAVAFLYQTDALAVGYIDGLLTDPSAGLKRKRAAIQSICTALVSEADALGLRIVWCQTPVSGLESILKHNGFLEFGRNYTCHARSR